jgi:hypothetical protein
MRLKPIFSRPLQTVHLALTFRRLYIQAPACDLYHPAGFLSMLEAYLNSSYFSRCRTSRDSRTRLPRRPPPLGVRRNLILRHTTEKAFTLSKATKSCLGEHPHTCCTCKDCEKVASFCAWTLLEFHSVKLKACPSPRSCPSQPCIF